MQLLRLRLVNFRQHADTELEFGPGITGIIGPNGSGKTSILEAIAWALYGVQAVRGDKDSIRRLGAKGRDGGARQDGAGGVSVARARVRAPARGAGAGTRSPQRGGGGGAGSRGRPPRRRGARRGAAGRGTATERGPQVGQERGRGAAGR